MSRWAVELVVALLSRLPLRVRRMLGAFGGTVASILPLKEKRVALLQLAKIGRFDAAPTLVTASYRSLGITLLESLALAPILEDPQAVRCHNFEEMRQRAAQRPVLALSAHLGNWELLAAYMVHRGLPVTTIARDARRKEGQRVLLGLRERYGVRTLWRSDPGALREVINAFRSHGVIAALVDQDTPSESRFSHFFGLPAKTPTALVDLALRYKTEIVTAFLVREEDASYRVVAEPILQPSSADEVLSTYHARLEALLRDYPEQWVWIHKRWRTQPTIDTMGTQAYLRYLASLT